MKKTPSHFTARVEIAQQISFFSFGFARVSEVRHIKICVAGNRKLKKEKSECSQSLDLNPSSINERY